ncbi:hypothetical protein FNV43_RR24740 [Rhamnella rubrinervis]|uniref:Uncharacterized protein n=1 Tax=Rhamnella rubrinervis TaxID=2594499 RepID=A0A8K0DM39_9ROSA|nr:hypothetical protein FNV43_RR24740 [Rhamnella rubrinervis]
MQRNWYRCHRGHRVCSPTGTLHRRLLSWFLFWCARDKLVVVEVTGLLIRDYSLESAPNSSSQVRSYIRWLFAEVAKAYFVAALVS